MVNVSGVQPPVGPSIVEPVGKAAHVAQAAEASGVSDLVEISLAAKLAAKVQEIPDIRADLVAKVKEEVAAGTYETPERLDIAINRLLDDLFPA